MNRSPFSRQLMGLKPYPVETRRALRASHVIALLLFSFAAVAAPPDVANLIKNVLAQQEAESPERRQCTWREEVTHRQFRKGNPEPATTRTFDALFLEGAIYRKLVLENGKPLPVKQQAKVDAEMEKERIRRKGQPRSTLMHRVVYLGGLDLIPKLFTVTITEDSLAGRAVWKLDALPRADVTPTTKEERGALATKRTLWIDRQENAIVRSRIEFLTAQEGIQAGTVLTEDYAPVNGDCWLTYHSEFNLHFSPVKFIKVGGTTEKRFLNYKKFDVGTSIQYENPK